MIQNKHISLLVFLCSTLFGAAADLPIWSPQDMSIRLALDKFTPLSEEGAAKVDGKLGYDCRGQRYLGNDGILFPNGGVPLNQATPAETLAELLVAYRAGDVTHIKALYLEGARGGIETMFADPAKSVGLTNFVKAITDGKLLFALEKPNSCLAFVRVTSAGQASILPFALVLQDGKYWVSDAESNGLESNVYAFLSLNDPEAMEVTLK